MAYSLTVAGYTFQNPPEEYRKLARLSNTPQTAFNRESTAFYQSDSQDIQFQVEGTLALDPPLGEASDDTDELAELQDLAIRGGEVDVEFDPFFSGKAVIEDDPFRQSEGESSYQFTFSVNSETTDDSAYPAHNTPDTGNTFSLGDLNLGYDPSEVSQNYERQTEQVKRLQGIARTVDTDGLIPKITISGRIDGGGQATLWDKARSNTLAYLSAEFQNGWALIDSISIRNAPEAPDYLTGLFQYDVDLMVVMDPGSGIGEVSKYVDQQVKEATEYVSNCDQDGIFERLGNDGESYPRALDFRVSGGTGKLNGDYIEWQEDFGTLDQSATNYIWVEDPDGDGYGQVNTGTSGFPGNSVPLFEVDTGTSSVNDIRDQRTCLTGSRLEASDLGDLNFTTDLSVDDRLDFERLLSLSDSLAVASSPNLPWLGTADLDPETLAVAEGPLDAAGIASLSDTVTVDDGGSPDSGGGGGGTEIETWGTSSDFDAGTSLGVVHDSFGDHTDGQIEQGFTPNEFGADAYVHYTFDESAGSGTLTDVSGNGFDATTNFGGTTLGANGLLNTTAADLDGGSDDVIVPDGLWDGLSEYTIFVAVRFDSVSEETIQARQSNGEYSDAVWRVGYESTDGSGGSNGEMDWQTGAGGQLFTSGANLQTGQLYILAVAGDSSDGRFFIDGVKNNQTGGDFTIPARGPSPTHTRIGAWDGDGGGHNLNGLVDEYFVVSTKLSDSRIAEISDYIADSSVWTSAFKTFGQAIPPANLTLENVVATLNGQNIDVYVESDTSGDGNVDEISDPISLDGSGGPYTVTGLSSSNDKFRIRVEPSTSDPFTSAVFGGADLVGEFAGADSDQNQNTTWEIQGARYDTSGNEYEGGGVVSRYGG